MRFEFDPEKDDANRGKHGVSLSFGARVFEDADRPPSAPHFYIIALRRIPLSVALPCTAASYIGAIFIGHFLYNETITLIHLTAVAFIGCGVILLAFSAK